jgi:hypothetical protein
MTKEMEVIISGGNDINASIETTSLIGKEFFGRHISCELLTINDLGHSLPIFLPCSIGIINLFSPQ